MTTAYPVSGAYGSIIQAYFGQIDAKDKQSLWNSFLKEEGLSANPTDVSKAADFLAFVQENSATQSVALSPTEVAKRQIMMNTFKSVLAMLTTLQNTVAVQAKSLLFLSKLQQQYTHMLAEVPVYTPDPTTIWTPSTDPSKFTFGYNNISVTDIADYLGYMQATTGSSSYQLQTAEITNQTYSLIPGVNGAIVVNPGDKVNLAYNMETSSGFPAVKIYVVNKTTGLSAEIASSTGALPTSNTSAGWSQAYVSAIMGAFQNVVQVRGSANTLQTDVQPVVYGGNYPSYPYTKTVTFAQLSFGDALVLSDGSNNLIPGVVGSWNSATSITQTTTYFSADPDDISAPVIGTGPTFNEQNMQFGSVYIPWEYSVNSLPEAITYTYGTGTQEHVIIGIDNIDSQKQQAITNMQQKIGEKNAQLQQYIQTITANKQVAQNQASTQQNSLNSIQQSVSNQNNLLTTIIQTMQGLITSIFK